MHCYSCPKYIVTDRQGFLKLWVGTHLVSHNLMGLGLGPSTNPSVWLAPN